MNHSFVWHQASSIQILPEVSNQHHIEVGPSARERDACFLHAEPTTQFRAEYPV